MGEIFPLIKLSDGQVRGMLGANVCFVFSHFVFSFFLHAVILLSLCQGRFIVLVERSSLLNFKILWIFDAIVPVFT